ncbi:MAG: diguanylate cyclase [Actinocatenispora sp.]
MSIDQDRLVDALATTVTTAPSVTAACQATVTALVDGMSGTVAVLLDLNGRLRCLAAAGAWQVFDGVPADAGVVGRVFRTGVTAVVTDVRADPDYIPLSPGVQMEVCAPIPGPDGAPVGVVNIESTDASALPEVRTALERAARLLADRIIELGGLPAENAGQRLLRHAVALSSAVDEPEVLDRALEAARDISGLSSAAIAMGSGLDIQVTAARGPLAGLLVIADRNAIALLATRTRRHGSTYSLGDPSALDARGFERLTAAGIRTMIAVPIGTRHDDGGVLLAVDHRVIRPDTRTVSLLEMLAAQSLVCLERVRLVLQLRLRASSDPLTGLGHHGRFSERLARARPAHTAVLAMDVDQFKAVNDTYGHQEGDRLLVELVRVLQGALRAEDELYRIGGDEFAAVVEVNQDDEALTVAQRLVSAARRVGRTISIGVALREAGETAENTLRRADEALYAVKRAGRDGARLADSGAVGKPLMVLPPTITGV